MKKLFIDARMIHSSGIGTYLRNIVPAVISLCEDMEFFLLGDEWELKQYSWTLNDRISVVNCKAPIYSVSEQLAIIRRIPNNTDAYWSPHYNIPLLYDGKLIVTVHDVYHLAMPQYVIGLHKWLYAKTMYTIAGRKAHRIVCVSQFTAQELVRLAHVSSNKIKVIHNGVNTAITNDDITGTFHSKPYILAVGNIKPNKNIVRLLGAFEKLMPMIPHDLIIVGKERGFITGDDEVHVRASKLKSRVLFTGTIDDRTLLKYYKNAALFVFPSFYEGFGLPPLEAMACGCPVVSSYASSLREVCGDAAYYVDPYDINSIIKGMLTVLTDKSLRETLRIKGYKRVQDFTWEKSAMKHAKLFKEALFA